MERGDEQMAVRERDRLAPVARRAASRRRLGSAGLGPKRLCNQSQRGSGQPQGSTSLRRATPSSRVEWRSSKQSIPAIHWRRRSTFSPFSPSASG